MNRRERVGEAMCAAMAETHPHWVEFAQRVTESAYESWLPSQTRAMRSTKAGDGKAGPVDMCLDRHTVLLMRPYVAVLALHQDRFGVPARRPGIRKLGYRMRPSGNQMLWLADIFVIEVCL